ncbi:MAG: hypothetical protein JOY68_05675 [Candidatus Dormibacteraeota bacterium]|nr:hypothetical protein [Candidatus Dormibacteraeota bacterium]MBV8445526.1 hypothetical protein [Candidatus Dormibacteraeota bacterium]
MSETSTQPAMSTKDIANVGTRDTDVNLTGATAASSADTAVGLLTDSSGFMEQWQAIQGMFVDEPRQAVERADALVAEVIQQLARNFADERQRLETEWAGGKDVSTEDLRLSLQRYREFFQTLLRS